MLTNNSFPDKTRGIFNEGGSFGERQGWHLPGFDTLDWRERPLSMGLPGNVAGLGFFVTEFSLDIPEGYDVPMSFRFDDGDGDLNYRAHLFINGELLRSYLSASDTSWQVG
jgi:hypothetical protein